ncbi:hypothetical protein [Shumkonia mesophila]|nr:hypothetical protein [Shumkonia mesophila]
MIIVETFERGGSRPINYWIPLDPGTSLAQATIDNEACLRLCNIIVPH